MRWLLLLTAISVIATTGCRKKESVETEGDLVASDQTTTAPEEQKRLEDMSPEEIQEMIEDAASVPLNPNFFKIPEPNTSGWKAQPAANSQSEIVRLGREIDRTLDTLDRAYAQVRMFYDIKGSEAGRLNGFGEVRLDQEGKFNIEYYMPATNESLHRVVSDGKRRAENIGGQWKQLPPIDASQPLTKEDLANFPVDFPQLMFANARLGSNIYGPLFEAWSKGEFGAKPQIERKTVEYQDRELELVRVHTTVTSPYKAQIEITFDGNRHVPIKIRSIKQEDDGTETHIVWDSQWAFSGGSHPREKFLIPSSAG